MSISDNLRSIRARIGSAAAKVGRNPEEITLIAISKNQSVEKIQEAYDAGIRIFGENRVQEALPKIAYLPKDIAWHLVGALQSNKARLADQNFQAIHSLENERQLIEIQKSGCPIDGLIQVNLSRETQKSGIFVEKLDEYHKTVLQYEVVRFRGLMTIGPSSQDIDQTRSLFRELRELGQALGSSWLSMGMSDDLEVAVEEGATHVRVGTALFGTRSMD
jgi:PLP dependent protein